MFQSCFRLINIFIGMLKICKNCFLQSVTSKFPMTMLRLNGV